MQVEICANGLVSARNAQLGGAHRIELCVDLSVGGVTPPLDLIQSVRDQLEIPVHVLIRPRSGNFVYTSQELNNIYQSIELCQHAGCAGVVSGALTRQEEVDQSAIRYMKDLCKNMEFTFHRAMDVVHEPSKAMEVLIDLGVNRILTSGGKPTAVEGMDRLIRLKAQAKERITVMPGGGISSFNAGLFKAQGFDAVHLSAIPKAPSQSLFNNPVSGVSDLKEIQKVVSLLS